MIPIKKPIQNVKGHEIRPPKSASVSRDPVPDKKKQNPVKTPQPCKPSHHGSASSKYNTITDASGKACFYTVGEIQTLSEWKARYSSGVKDLLEFKQTLVV